ncbi:MAG: VWA domain-containing protein [Bacteroidetes bacterium]|nr:VWA domain-containing protein [Bacteroidota bacterium]MCW5896013.1 VWA domain-containing protein [Bacteroidota bacterium]
MKTSVGCIVVAFMMAASTLASAVPTSKPTISMEGKLNCPYITSSGGTVYLQIILTTSGFERPSRERRPMNLSVVLDRSGSMSDQRKMEYAKTALATLIDKLERDDIFSLVVYDDVVDVMHSAQRVGSDRNRLKQLVSDIYPRNSTNLGGGMIEGLKQVEKNVGKEYVNRVILLSDGLANQGITSPIELNRIAKRYRERSISLTTMGVGLEYNENLMIGLAESGGGNYYFIESPTQLASMMNREFNSASSIVAQNVSIELQLGKGVRLLDVIGCETISGRNVYRIPIGDVYANDTREITVELSIPKGSGTATVATGNVRYESSRISFRPSFAASVVYTSDLVLIDRNRDMEVQAKADVAASTRDVERAMKALDEGRKEEAQAQLQSAKAFLGSSPAAASSGAGGDAIRAQAERLDSYDAAVRDAEVDANQVKKAIQYENYRVQKKK